jgi:hypothetical protein
MHKFIHGRHLQIDSNEFTTSWILFGIERDRFALKISRVKTQLFVPSRRSIKSRTENFTGFVDRNFCTSNLDISQEICGIDLIDNFAL